MISRSTDGGDGKSVVGLCADGSGSGSGRRWRRVTSSPVTIKRSLSNVTSCSDADAISTGRGSYTIEDVCRFFFAIFMLNEHNLVNITSIQFAFTWLVPLLQLRGTRLRGTDCFKIPLRHNKE